ncbi:MAG: aspartate-semialdehyde dehydrogenase [Patescibacteria group bacterium]|nr:aspartate-semialdehyde dehydrogenase [Patescibacteria group bacterium]
MSNNRLKVGILGATGMVGQRFVSLLENHPWFDVVCVAASPQSAGKKYSDAVAGRWAMVTPVPGKLADVMVKAVEEDFGSIVKEVDLVFSAIDADKEKIKAIEEKYAAAGVAVVSNNSAHRWTPDVPMMIPEVNADHAALIDAQRKNRGWTKGLLVVKPNCSLQSYVPVIHALRAFKPTAISVTTLQAISGAGKTFTTWPEMADNCIPFIKGEEEKTEREPMKIWGSVEDGAVKPAESPVISATCIRVAVADGHMASVSVAFENRPTLEQIREAIGSFENPLAGLGLPSAPEQFIRYFTDDDRPQTKLDRDFEHGMGITCGRFREEKNGNWKFVALSHNTIRGAAGGAILIAEFLYQKGYVGSNA